MSDNRPVVMLVLRLERDGVPDMVRLRRVVKAFLRQYGMTCLYLEQLWPALPVQASPPDAPAAGPPR